MPDQRDQFFLTFPRNELEAMLTPCIKPEKVWIIVLDQLPDLGQTFLLPVTLERLFGRVNILFVFHVDGANIATGAFPVLPVRVVESKFDIMPSTCFGQRAQDILFKRRGFANVIARHFRWPESEAIVVF